MLNRKIYSKIVDYLKSSSSKMLVIDGARQVGKSFIIRKAGQEIFPNYIEVNMERDRLHDRLFADVRTTEDFYLALSSFAGERMGRREDTLVFIDEIQAYDHLLTMVKFLMDEGRFTYIASGSQLGITLKKTQSVPVGSLQRIHMYPLDFEEFLWACGVGEEFVDNMRHCFKTGTAIPDAHHRKIMDLLRKYLLVGGLPDAVNTYLAEHNILSVRKIQTDIRDLYLDDAAKYEKEARRKLKIQAIYRSVPSNLENKKKRIVARDVEGKKGKRMTDYEDEFEYLISAGIALDVKAVSTPTYPLVQNTGKNLLKLYLNDVGLLTSLLYRNNIQPVIEDIRSINLGSVYENFVAMELRAHGFQLCYYDNKKNGEVDFLIDDVENMSSLPVEVKSGKDYTTHSAISKFIAKPDYNVRRAVVLSNQDQISEEIGITYLPIYNCMFLNPNTDQGQVEF